MNNETHPTIETQIKEIIGETMTAFHEENKEIITNTIKVVVNGKIDSFRADQKIVNDSQNKALEEIKTSVKNVVNLYDGSGKFFRVVKTVSVWITAVGGAAIVVWSFIKFIIP